jgi:hypothetical protein
VGQGYQIDEASDTDNMWPPQQQAYETDDVNEINNGYQGPNQFPAPAYPNEINSEDPENPDEAKHIMELMAIDDDKSSGPTQSKIFKNPGGNNQKLRIFLGCILYVVIL